MRVAAPSLAALSLLAAGCATVVSGSTQTVRVTTVPADATVNLAGEDHQAPVELLLTRRQSYVATIHRDGYLTLHRAICQVGNPATEGNLLLGGIGGIVTDQSTGAAFALYPSDLRVELPPTTPAERTYDRRSPP